MSVKAFIKYAATTTHKNNVTGAQIDAEIKTSAFYIFDNDDVYFYFDMNEGIADTLELI